MVKKKEKIDWKIVCTGIVCIAALEAFALYKGINGTIFAVVIAVIAGAIGVVIPTPNILKE